MIRRGLKLGMTILFLAGIFLLSRQTAVYVDSFSVQNEEKKSEGEKPVIVLDAGHGGSILRNLKLRAWHRNFNTRYAAII